MNEFDKKAMDWDLDPEKAARARTVAEAIASDVPVTPAMTALKYGCGTELLGLFLQPRLAHLTLADNSEGMLDVLRRKVRSNGVQNVTPLRLDPPVYRTVGGTSVRDAPGAISTGVLPSSPPMNP